MNISSININPIGKMYNTPIKRSKISFTGSEDTFVKTGVQTFADAKKTIQMKYQPAISKLRAERENVCNKARDVILTKIAGRSDEAEDVRDTISLIYDDYEQFRKGNSYRAIEANLTHRLDGLYIGNGTGGYYKAPNCLMCVSKDKELGEKVFRDYEYYMRGCRMFPNKKFSNKDLFSINKKFSRYNNHDTITEFEKIVQDRVAPFRIDFKSIDDVLPENPS
ncbi:MAG: hypothetical protein LUH05_00605, partial [Candidatus Gastranaerophilales bacterium]|nr:hypothetical protein [Candidatus Gastranaerophilales bacterium]